MMNRNKIYLDYNGTTPLAPEVIEDTSFAMKHLWANPSSTYDIGTEARNSIDKAREQVACMIGANAKEIIFTSGGTESNNMLLNSVAENFQLKYSRTPHFVTSVFEHDSILKVLDHLERCGKISLTKLKISPQTGSIDLGNLMESLTNDTAMVTVMLANNETGIIQPIEAVTAAIREFNSTRRLDHRVLVHSDAAQALGKIGISVNELGVDYLTIVGHKFYGPRVGALYVRDLDVDGTCNFSQIPIRPLVHGGGQERDLRSGTENTPMIVGLGKASELVTLHTEKYHNRMLKVRDHLEKCAMFKFKDFGCKILSKFPIETRRLPNTCSISLATNCNITGPEILSNCKRVQASVGAACHSMKAMTADSQYEGSATLYHCGYSAVECRSAIRLSVGRDTTESNVEAAIDDLYAAVIRCTQEK